MTEITFQCPACGQEYTVDAELGGKDGHCEICDHEFPIPTVDSEIDTAPPVDARTRNIASDISDLVQRFVRLPEMPWDEKKRLLKHLDLCVVAFREHLENLEEQEKLDQYRKRQLDQ